MSNPAPASGTCRVCGGPAASRFVTTERRYGLGGEFAYAICADCASVSLIRAPADLAAYYPNEYYAFGALPDYPLKARVVAAVAARLPRGMTLGLAQRVASCTLRSTASLRRDLVDWLGAEPPRSARVLDIGCGAGHLLQHMQLAGYPHLTGIDPYAPASPQAPFLRAGLALDALEGEFDLVMLHHSLEHAPDPCATLAAAAQRLAPGGRLLVRVPKTPADVFDEYGPNWFELDPPRHLFIPSVAGLERLAAGVGLRVTSARDEPNEIDFIVSEAYRRSLWRPGAQPDELFDPAATAALRRRAYEAAQRGRAGRAIFVLQAG